MARHNRDAKGVDQHGELWHLSYHPDWIRRIKISRELPDGSRRSSVTLFKNPAEQARAEPAKVIRTRVQAADGSADFEISLEDRTGVVESITVVARRERDGEEERLEFDLRDDLPGPSEES